MACRSETCCPPVSTYKSDADARATVPGSGCPVPTVTIFPADGTYVILPTFVALSCNVAGAVIYFTVDGTEPTEDSPVYSAPFQVSSNATVVLARAKLAGCDIGPVSRAQYPVLVGSNWQFGYLCETGDQAGVFGEFAANGAVNDYQFVLLFTLDADTEMLDITVLQTDGTGLWESGQSWSTTEWIYPFPNPAVPFHTYPLVLIDEAGPTQLFTSYQTTLGVITAGTYEWRMWGQPATPLDGFFLCRITLAGGTVIKRLIEATCTPPPPPCPAPVAPTLSAFCTPTVQIEGTYATEVRVWTRSMECGDGLWTLLTTKAAGTWIYHHVSFQGVEKCCTFEYYVDYLCSGNYIASPIASILVPCECEITAAADVDNICPGDDVVLSFEGMNCVGEISWGTGGEFGSFTGTGVLVGTVTVNPSVTTTYTFMGSSTGCGDSFVEVTVTVIDCTPPPSCNKSLYADSYQFNGDPVEIFEDWPLDCSGLGMSMVAATGAGLLLETADPNECRWGGTLENPSFPGNGFNIAMALATGGWSLSISAQIAGEAALVWVGFKAIGLTPVGSYTRTSGCLMIGTFTVA